VAFGLENGLNMIGSKINNIFQQFDGLLLTNIAQNIA
jgi:hypothetical protein